VWVERRGTKEEGEEEKEEKEEISQQQLSSCSITGPVRGWGAVLSSVT